MRRLWKILSIRCIHWMMKDGQRIAERDGDWFEYRDFARKRGACERRLRQLGYTLAITIWLSLGTVVANAQTDCPPDKVCLTQAQAAKYLTLEDTVKAQENEILALKKAVLDQKEVTVDAKIALAEKSGENTVLKQQIVGCNADKEILIKFGRVRKFGLINF